MGFDQERLINAVSLLHLSEAQKSAPNNIFHTFLLKRDPPLLSPVSSRVEVPMDRVITFRCLRTSLTTMLLCSGVARQHSTERQCRASARNFSSSPPWKMMLSVCPSTTSPNSGLGASETEEDVGMMPKSFLCDLSYSEFFFTSSRVKFKRDSQVSCEKTDVVLEIVISISLCSTAPCQM